MGIVEMVSRTHLSKMTVIRNIKKLMAIERVVKVGKGRSTIYHLK
jgi:hypothetical protein